MKTAIEMAQMASDLDASHRDITKNTELKLILADMETEIRRENGRCSEICFEDRSFENPLTKGHLESLGYTVTEYMEDYERGAPRRMIINFGARYER